MSQKANILDYCVYAHIAPNGKMYIGITGMRVHERWNHGKGYKKCPYFWKAIVKYGWDNIKHIILVEHITREMAGECEKYLIQKYKTNNNLYGYNNSPGGEKGNYGYRFTYEQRQKLSKRMKGHKMSEEARRKIGENSRRALTGRKMPEEVKKKISESNKGRHPQNQHPSEEARRKNSLAHMGKQYHLGFKHSEETRRKMSLAKLGKPLSEAQKKQLEKLHKAAIGRKHNYLNGNSRAVILNGIYYPTITSAAQSIGVSNDTLAYHLNGKSKIKKYDCKYAIEEGA